MQADYEQAAIELGRTLAAGRGRLQPETVAVVERNLRIIDAARSWLLEAEAAGLGDQDYSAMLARILQGRAGQQPVGRERSPASEPPDR